MNHRNHVAFSHTRAKSVRSFGVQAQADLKIDEIPPWPQSLPVAPQRARHSRVGVWVKYWLPVNGGGIIFVSGDGGDPFSFSQGGTAFPILGNTGLAGHAPEKRRQKQMFIPATNLVSVFLGSSDAFEGACWLEVA